jgi:hypothetical protein
MKPFVITAVFAAAAALMAFQSSADPLSPPETRGYDAVAGGGGVVAARNYAEYPSASFGAHEGLPWGMTVSRNAIHSLDSEG